jgi:hypothetical protein
MARHNSPFFEVHVRQHHVLARDEAAADGVGKLVDGHIAPAVVGGLGSGFHEKGF